MPSMVCGYKNLKAPFWGNGLKEHCELGFPTTTTQDMRTRSCYRKCVFNYWNINLPMLFDEFISHYG